MNDATMEKIVKILSQYDRGITGRREVELRLAEIFDDAMTAENVVTGERTLVADTLSATIVGKDGLEALYADSHDETARIMVQDGEKYVFITKHVGGDLIVSVDGAMIESH